MKKSFMIVLGVITFGISGGNGWAAPPATDVVCIECINDTDIAANAVTEPKLAPGAVTTTKIGDLALLAARLPTGILRGYCYNIVSHECICNRFHYKG